MNHDVVHLLSSNSHRCKKDLVDKESLYEISNFQFRRWCALEVNISRVNWRCSWYDVQNKHLDLHIRSFIGKMRSNLIFCVFLGCFDHLDLGRMCWFTLASHCSWAFWCGPLAAPGPAFGAASCRASLRVACWRCCGPWSWCLQRWANPYSPARWFETEKHGKATKGMVFGDRRWFLNSEFHVTCWQPLKCSTLKFLSVSN